MSGDRAAQSKTAGARRAAGHVQIVVARRRAAQTQDDVDAIQVEASYFVRRQHVHLIVAALLQKTRHAVGVAVVDYH